MCGKDTFYLWDFQTDDNPDGKMPACLGTKSLLISLKIAQKKSKNNLRKESIYIFYKLYIFFWLIIVSCCVSEIKDGKKLQVSYTASYKDLECDTKDKYVDVRKSVPETVQLGLNNIECVSTGVCFLERVTVTDCSERQKRSTTVTTAGLDVSLSCDPTSRKSKDIFYHQFWNPVKWILYTSIYINIKKKWNL